MRTRLLALLTVWLSATVAASPQAPGAAGTGTLLVLAKTDLTLSMVDPVTFKVLGQVPSGPDPHEVVASGDGRVAYISNYGGGSLNTITVVDLVERKPLQTIALGALRGPHGLDFVGGKLYFTAEGAKVVGRYDPVTREVDLVLGTGQNRTHMVEVSADGRRIVTTNVSSASVTILELSAGGRGQGPAGPPPPGGPGGPGRAGPPGAAAGGMPGTPAGAPPGAGAPPPGRGRGGAPQANWEATVVAVGRGVEGFDISPDGREIWAANAQDGTISVVDAATKAVTHTLQANVNGANRLKFTPDGTRVLVSTLAGPDLLVLDASSKKPVKRIAIGRGAAGIQIQPDGARAYIACTPDDNVAVIDLRTLEVVGRIEAGRQPDGLAWAGSR